MWPAERRARRGRGMDSIGGARIAVDQFAAMPVDSIEDQLREIRRERDALRRENRVLKIAVAELERVRSEEHTSELQSLMRNSYAVFCLNKKKPNQHPIEMRFTNAKKMTSAKPTTNQH